MMTGYRKDEALAFYPDATARNLIWQEEEAVNRKLSYFEVRTSLFNRVFDPGAVTLKGRVTNPGVAGLPRAAFPWMQPAVWDYIYRLPASARYDLKTRTNKVLLRQLLWEKLDYDANAVGKHVFGFERIPFILRYHRMLESQVLSCSLWKRGAIDRTFAALLQQTEAGDERASLKLLNLFLLSMWHNHSIFARNWESEDKGLALPKAA
jgi:hypothetical protein